MFASRGVDRSTVVQLQSHYGDSEREYAAWVHRFVERLSDRLPDEPPSVILAAAERWAHQCDRLFPEDAAEIAAMWWDRQ